MNRRYPVYVNMFVCVNLFVVFCHIFVTCQENLSLLVLREATSHFGGQSQKTEDI